MTPLAKPLAIGIALVGIAACSGGSAAGHRTAGGNLPGVVVPSPTSAAYAAQVRARRQATVGYAQRLAARAPRLAGERPYRDEVPHDLRAPDETIGAADLVIRSDYWTVPGGADHVYRLLKHATPAGLRLTGYGLPSSAAEGVAGRGFVHFDPDSLPAYIQGGELYIEMQDAGRKRTIIAAFGEAYSHPVRIPTEHILPAGATARARWPRFALDPKASFGKVVAHPSETLTRDQVAAVIDGFNASPVTNAPQVCLGGYRANGDELTVTIRSAGHTWVLGYPGTSCYDISVTRDGVSFPALQPLPALRHVLAVLKHADGNVAGHLYAVGGPDDDAPLPLPGTITLSTNGKAAATVHTRDHGYFLLPAPPGTYTATATSRRYNIDGHPGLCRSEHPVTVSTETTARIDIYCQLR